MAALVSAPARLAGSTLLACQSDERLVALARSGHTRAFEALIERYRRPLTRFCTRMLPESRAEDAVQQTFMNVHVALKRDDAPVDFKPWLYRIARNASLNLVRQNGWNHEQIPLDYDGVRRPDQVVEQRIELQSTVAAIGDLPERQRDALVMREFEGRSYTEIAVLLGAGDGAVRQLLNRARASLRSAATMLTPPPLVARVASTYPRGDGSRMSRAAEVLGGIGAGGAVKAGATALVAGSLVVGAVKAPLPIVGHHHKTAHHRVSVAPVSKSSAAGASSVGDNGAAQSQHGHGAAGTRQSERSRGDHGRNGTPHSRRNVSRGEDRGAPLRRSEDGARRQPVTREEHSGVERTGSGEHSGSTEPTDSGEHTVSGGTDGSSGETTSGSGGSDGSTTTSGSDGSTTSGSTTGSSDSGSGSTETTTTPSSDPGTTSSTTSSGDGISGSGSSSTAAPAES